MGEVRKQFELEFDALVSKKKYSANKISDKEICEIIHNMFPNLLECKWV